MKTKAMLIAGIGFLLAALPARAHHALAAKYDTRQSIVLTGTVTKINWNNPHVVLYMQAMDRANMGWEFELGSPNLLMLNGWTIHSFRKGDHVVVTAYPARDGTNFGYASKVALSK